MTSAGDKAIFFAADLWVRLRHRRVWRRLRNTQRRDGARGPVFVARPRVLNEKMAWRKVFDNDPLFSIFNDKLACKDWVREQGIGVPTPATLWAGTRAEDIPDRLLERPVVVKCNLSSGLNLFVETPPRDRAALNAAANAFLDPARHVPPPEWRHLRIEPRLFVEALVGRRDTICDLKLYVQGGQVVRAITLFGTGNHRTGAVWTLDAAGHAVGRPTRPVSARSLDDRPITEAGRAAFGAARRIGRHCDNLRVDFLVDATTAYLGEITFNNLDGRASDGFRADAPQNLQWSLARSWFMTTPQPGWREVYRRALKRDLARQDRAPGTFAR